MLRFALVSRNHLSQKILSLRTKRFKNISCAMAALDILWHVQVVQLLTAARQRVVKIMGLAAPIAATN